MQTARHYPMLTMPSRALCPEPGQKPHRYQRAVETDIRKTFEKARRLIAMQKKS